MIHDSLYVPSESINPYGVTYLQFTVVSLLHRFSLLITVIKSVVVDTNNMIQRINDTFPQILMSVLIQLEITVVLMPTALTLSEVMTAPVKLDIQEMDTHVMVCEV